MSYILPNIKSYVQIIDTAIANFVGLDESIIICQLHYWIEKSNKTLNNQKWVYNSYEDWHKQFPYWSCSKIKRLFLSLERSNILLSKKVNAKKYDHTKWYTINYQQLNMVCGLKDTHSPFTEGESDERIGEQYHALNQESNSTRIKVNKNSTCIPHDMCLRGNSSLDNHSDHLYQNDSAKLEQSYSETKYTTYTTNKLSLSTTFPENHEREMINIWNEVFKEEGRAEIKTNAARKTSLQNIFHDYFESSLDKWRDYCIKITTSKFLMGESKASSFKATLDWSIKPDSIAKILEGEHYGIGDRVKNHKANNLLQPELAPHMLVQNNLWKEILKKFEDRYSIAEAKSWIAKLEFEQVDQYTVRLCAPSRFIMESIDQKYKADLLKYVSELSSYKIRCILLEYGPHSITYRTVELLNHKETLEIRPSDIMIAEVPAIPTVRVYKEEYNQDYQCVGPFGQQQIGQQANEGTNAISSGTMAKKLPACQDHFIQNMSVNGLKEGYAEIREINTYPEDLTKEGRVENKITLNYIQPGIPQQNAYSQSHNRTVRHERLEKNEFSTIQHLQEEETKWIWTYNNTRPNKVFLGKSGQITW